MKKGLYIIFIGNYAVVGSFLPEIEIWDLDTLDVLEPTMVLGKELRVLKG